MNATLRPTRSSLVPLAVLAVASAVTIALLLGKHDIGGPDMARQAAAATAAVTAVPENAAMPLVLTETVAVTEPDPEAFNIDGIEWWWAHHPRAHVASASALVHGGVSVPAEAGTREPHRAD